MIGANNQTPNAQIIYLNRLEVKYRELLELRERVKKAEAAVFGLKTSRRALPRTFLDPSHRR
jgi:hypothetical protein